MLQTSPLRISGVKARQKHRIHRVYIQESYKNTNGNTIKKTVKIFVWSEPMFCGECGTENPDTNQFCKSCGKPLKKKQQQPVPVPAQVPAIPKNPGFCGECGTENPDTNQFCKNCGKPLRKAQPSAAPAPAPVATYSPPPQNYYVPPPPAPLAAGTPAVAKPPLNKNLLLLAIVSIFAGAVSLFRYPYLCGILAIALGSYVLYKSENKKSKAAILGIIGIVIGLASIIVNLFYFSFFPPVAVNF